MGRGRLAGRIALPGLVALALLVSMPALSAEPVTIIRANGASANRVDIVILGDGYTAAEIASGQYAIDVEQFVNGVFAQEPFSEYRNYFNVARIDVTSAESGADHPSMGIYRDTALDAAYDCAGIQRLICVNTSKVNAVISASGIAANARDMVIVIVNDTEYGGSGGAIAVASIHPSVVELVLHEGGHSFGQLADEYGGPPPPSCVTTEPVNANATRQTVRELIKWVDWIDPSTPVPTPTTINGVPGLYEGAVYCDSGAYRPTYNSKMRSLGPGFEQVNIEQLVKRTYNFVSPIDGSSPAGSVIPTGATQAFSVTVPQPFTHDLDIEWRLDGALQVTGDEYTATGLTNGVHTVTATVRDPTPMVRNDPVGLLETVRTWTLNTSVVAAPVITLHPTDRSLVAGADTTFAAAATGAPTWQWQVSTNGGASWSDLVNGAPYSGVTTSTLALTSVPAGLHGARYRAVATNAGGPTATNSALLTVVGAGANLVANGDFSSGATGWLLWELPDIVWSATGGVFQFYRQDPPTTASGQAVVFQETHVAVGAATPLAASFDIGNSSAVRKRISVLILDGDFSDLAVCTFWLAPGAPLSTYQMRTHPTKAWANAAIYFYAATGGSDGGYYELDNVSLAADESGSLSRTDCVDPNAPTPPGGADSANLLTNGDFGTGLLTPWVVFGTIVYQIADGVFEFYRPVGEPSGVVLQESGASAVADEIFTARFDLGNSSGVRKRVTVLLHDADFSDLTACTWYLEPGAGLATYALRAYTTEAWPDVTLSIYPATIGTDEAIRLDNAEVRRTPAGPVLGTECFEPGSVPPAPAPRMSGVR